ncbi:MAG TPA: TIR domain-containing protein [Aggregatilineales bacterium]|nr:TIR domain-containing protein [Aggregatilineales bacterium]
MAFDKKRIFISYAREDKAFAEQLHEQLSKYGLDVWLDVKSVPPGADWAKLVAQDISRSDGLLLIMSPDSKASPNVEVEWQQMLTQGKPVIPLFFRAYGGSFSPEIDKLSYIDVSSQSEHFTYKFRRILDGLKAQGFAVTENLTEGLYVSKTVHVGSPPSSSVQAAPPGSARMPLIIGGIVIAAAIIALLLLRPGAGATTATATPTEPPTAVPASTTPAAEITSPTETQPAPTDTAPAPIATTASASAGSNSIDVRVVYSGPDSLTVIVQGDSNFADIGLLAAGAEESIKLVERFDGLQLAGGTASAGACLRFVQDGNTPPLPTDCESSKLFSRTVSSADVFWWDTVANQARSLSVRRGDENLQLCSAAVAAAAGCVIQG